MKCEASSINKYLDKNLNIFFIYGSEIILKNNSKDLIKRKLLSKGFDEKKIINKNDFNNIEYSIKEVKRIGGHAQGTIAYTTSPVHNLDTWLDLAKKIEDSGADSLAIKDMAGLLRPYDAYELVTSLKDSLSIPIHMQTHATTGMSTATNMKAIEAGIDNIDTSISSLSMTYGHTATETMLAIFVEQDREIDLSLIHI